MEGLVQVDEALVHHHHHSVGEKGFGERSGLEDGFIRHRNAGRSVLDAVTLVPDNFPFTNQGNL